MLGEHPQIGKIDRAQRGRECVRKGDGEASILACSGAR